MKLHNRAVIIGGFVADGGLLEGVAKAAEVLGMAEEGADVIPFRRGMKYPDSVRRIVKGQGFW